jgi:hypothetical protein
VCVEPLNYNFIMKEKLNMFVTKQSTLAYHVDSPILEDGDYELNLEPESGLSEDSVQVTEEVTEAPNQGSEVFNSSDSSFTSEGKPRCITQFSNLCTYLLFLYCAFQF